MISRRSLLATTAAWPLPWAEAWADGAPRERGVLRVAFPSAEAGFDPPRVGDQTSLVCIAHLFESPLTWDPLARPPRLVPLTAAALPESHDGFRRWVFTLRPGILFTDDPVFGGRPRELTAADQVYSLKRYFDPAIPTEHLQNFENLQILGLSALRRQAMARKQPLDYDAPVEGLVVLDRYRFELRLAAPAPRLPYQFSGHWGSAVAREAVEAYAADPMAHPVGTGPFRLAQWRRGSLIVLARNTRYRDLRFEATPAADDAEGQALLARLKGRRLPLVDRVEVAIIEESQPQWLAFESGALDHVRLPSDFIPVAAPGGVLAPRLARRGIRLQRSPAADVTHTFFNCDDPMVGGNVPAQVALRRAVALACDNAEHVRLIRGGQALPAMSMIPPHTFGFDPALVSEMGSSQPARAAALLDLHGFKRTGPGGWRTRPDGSPLELRLASTGDQLARRRNELWERRMTRLGLRMTFEVAPFAELIRKALAGRLQMWGFTWTAGDPDADFFLGLAYGPNAEQSNDARFRLAAFDALYEAQRVLPDGPERLALIHRARNLMLAYMPYIPHDHRYDIDLLQPGVEGFRAHPFGRRRWVAVEVDADARGGRAS